jgi:copper(I)-binding protein
MMRFVAISAFILVGVQALPANAEVRIEGSWARATVMQQKSSGAFMRITASKDSRLVEVRSGAAGAVEIHEMVMDKDVMRMRPLAGLDLPGGKVVELKPGGNHLMLLNLRQQLKDGENVPLTLIIEAAGGARESVEINVPIKPLNQAGQHGHAQH